jgi:beta-phosphoglucomutase
MSFAIIFDMDGVIIDSNPYHQLAWAQFLVKKGIPFDDRIFQEKISGKTGDATLRLLLGTGLHDAEISGYLEEIDGCFQQILRNQQTLRPVDGLLPFMDLIREAGGSIALATSAPPGNVSLILEKLQLENRFEVITDRTHVRNGKPDPEVYLRTVRVLKIPKERCRVVEDSRSGILAALNAGLRVAGITTSLPEEALREAGAFMVIHDFNLLIPETLFDL